MGLLKKMLGIGKDEKDAGLVARAERKAANRADYINSIVKGAVKPKVVVKKKRKKKKGK